jgi:hypothetical protein
MRPGLQMSTHLLQQYNPPDADFVTRRVPRDRWSSELAWRIDRAQLKSRAGAASMGRTAPVQHRPCIRVGTKSSASPRVGRADDSQGETTPQRRRAAPASARRISLTTTLNLRVRPEHGALLSLLWAPVDSGRLSSRAWRPRGARPFRRQTGRKTPPVDNRNRTKPEGRHERLTCHRPGGRYRGSVCRS